MKRANLIGILFAIGLAIGIALGFQAFGQVTVSPRWVATLPATCDISTRPQNLWYKYSALAGARGLYYCSATNTFTPVGSLQAPGGFYNTTIFGVIGFSTTGLGSNGDYVSLVNQGQALLTTRYNAGSGQHVSLYSTAPLVWSSSGGAEDAAQDAGIKRLSPGVLGTVSDVNGSTIGAIPGVALTSITSDTTLNNNNSAQSIFAAAEDTWTVPASTSYVFEALYLIASGTTTHTTATLFGGTATYTSLSYHAELWSVTDGTINTTAPSTLRVTTASSTVLNATSVAPFTIIRLQGVIRVNGAGTIIPQIQFSAAPGGTNNGKVNSYFTAYPIGTNTTTKQGQWN